MSEPPVQQKIVTDTSDPEAKLNRVKALALETVEEAKRARREVMQQVSMAMANISSMMASYSVVMSLMGAQSDAFFSALIGMTLSTISMLISISVALAATTVGIPASVYIMGVAASLNALAIAKLVVDKIHSSGLWDQITAGAHRAEAQFQQGQARIGGGF